MSTTPSITIRPADARGHTDLGWLDSRHTFSFGGYHDAAHMAFHALRVINDDRVAPGGGFGMHGHRDMEIISLVLDGGLAHRDSLGNEGVVRAGGVQYMSAGSGVRHSEFNVSETEPVHFLQIWIEPDAPGGEPRYVDADPTSRLDAGALVPIATASGRDGSITMRADAELLMARTEDGGTLRIDDDFPAGWVHVIDGTHRIDDTILGAGDGASITGGRFELRTELAGRLLVFRLR
jgi:redox-sensitive bicupin YhaK (pirin superfamily)